MAAFFGDVKLETGVAAVAVRLLTAYSINIARSTFFWHFLGLNKDGFHPKDQGAVLRFRREPAFSPQKTPTLDSPRKTP
jgi:hypothetical protein